MTFNFDTGVFVKEGWKIKKAFSVIYIIAVLFLAAFSSTGLAQVSWKFIVTCDSRGSDYGINQIILSELVTEIKSQGVDFVMFSGDLVSGNLVRDPNIFESQLRVWVEMMTPLYDANIPVYVCRGNHELGDVWSNYPSPGTSPDPNDNNMLRWLNVFGNDSYPKQKLPENGPADEKFMTYSVTHKNAFIVMLDNYAGTRHDFHHKVKQEWLDNQLAANTKPHIFFAGHEQAFRALHTDCLDYFPYQRDAFWTAIKNAGGRTYFCGHDHFYDHARVDDGDGNPNNDIHQFIIGTAGAPPYTWSPPYAGNNTIYTVEQWNHAKGYGYVLVEIDGPNVKLIWTERHSKNLNIPGIYEPNEVWGYTVTPKPIVLSPNSGENLSAAGNYTISWKTIEGTITDSVIIEYSLDYGLTWQEIGSSPNTGWYEWDSLPRINSNECLIRISDLNNTLISDTSDNVFSISKCRTKLKADLNGDCTVDILDFAILADYWLK
ncbi:MAG: metallophosphoesterase [Planctomycetes bacterium]|nr:metallophosphoesterase [Planctomycetota bacterium]MBL7145471.1 metallophosphoesterase [Phycisphaerae bacterium]